MRLNALTESRYFIVPKNEPSLVEYLKPFLEKEKEFNELNGQYKEEMGYVAPAISNVHGVMGWFYNVDSRYTIVPIPDGLKPYKKNQYDCLAEPDGQQLKIYVPAAKRIKDSHQYREYLNNLNEKYVQIPDKVVECFKADNILIGATESGFGIRHTKAVLVKDHWILCVPWSPKASKEEREFDPRIKEIKTSQFIAILEEGVDPNES